MKMIAFLDNKRHILRQMYRQKASSLFSIGLILSFVLFFLWYSLPIILSGVENNRMVAVFNYDEAHYGVGLLNNMFEKKTLDTNYYTYGSVYFYITVFPLFIYKHFSPLTETVIIIMLRFVSVFFGCLSLFGLYALGKKIFSPKIGLLASLLFLATPVFLWRATGAHPDATQIYFSIISLYFCCSLSTNFTYWNIFMASVFAGLSFGTKYLGIFFLPIIWLAGYLSCGQKEELVNLVNNAVNNYFPVKRLFISIILSIIVFTATFILTNPYSIINLNLFLKSIKHQSDLLYLSAYLKPDSNGFLWINALASSYLIGTSGLVLFFGFLLKMFFNYLKTIGKSRFELKPGIVILFCVIFLVFTFLFFRVNARDYRFILPIVPFMLLFVAKALQELWNFNKLGRIIAVLFLVLILWPKLLLDINSRNWLINKTSNNVYIKAGKWLANNFPSDYRIVYDTYSYIPPTFKYVSESGGGISKKSIEEFNPHLIVINNKISSLYANPENAVNCSRGSVEYNNINQFYTNLRANKFLPYVLVKDFGEVKIFSRI
ncbi:MAG: glycosyltransferase family 39 protein [bacterium]